ncbi:MAG TPA: VRR-NUC domain-containing protein [Anaerolineae bacterium]|nr:VRR-NUC domain-containing protein [Anaerolineae bacterium]
MWDGRRKESSLEASVVEWAKKHGVHYCIKLQGTGNKSLPDRLFFMPGGIPFLVEFKKLGEKPTKLQEFTHAELRAQGYDVEVHDTRQGAIAALKQRLDPARLSAQGGEVSP